MDILWVLIVVFAMFSAILFPVMSSFSAGTGYHNLNENLSAYETGTLGNLGYSSVQCATIPLNVGKINLVCPFGSIGEIYDRGINLSDNTASNCANNNDIKQCQPDSTSYSTAMAAAIGQESYLYNFGSYTNLFAGSGDMSGCDKSNDSRIFIQFTCEQSKESLNTKYNQMCLAVSIAVFIAMFFTITIRYLYQGGKITQIEWDMSTVTAGDYTVEFDILPERLSNV